MLFRSKVQVILRGVLDMVIAMPLTRRIEAENFIVFGLDYMNYNGLNTGKYLLFLV